MNNPSNNHGVLTGAQAVILSDNEAKEERKEMKRNVLFMIMGAVGCVCFLLIYYQWQQIPFRKHTFQAEHLASVNETTLVNAMFYLCDAKCLDMGKSIDTNYTKSKKTEYTIPFKLNEAYTESCRIKGGSANPTHPKRICGMDSLQTIIGQTLYSELNENNIDFNKYTDVFFYRHCDNEIALEKSGYKDHLIVNDDDCIIFEKNRYALSDFAREQALHIDTYDFYKEPVNSETMAKSMYKNMTQAFMLAYRKKIFSIAGSDVYGFDAITTARSKVSSDFRRFFSNLFKLEDISQTHYSITLQSRTIPDLYLRMDFLGTIQCTYSHKKSVYDSETIDDSKYTAVNVGDSYIELIRKNNSTQDIYFDVLVKFNDMQNMQAFRLFMLAAIITLCFTQMVKSSVKLLLIFNKRRNRNTGKIVKKQK